MSSLRIIVVVKRTAYQRFVEEEGDPRARLLIKRRDPTVANWLKSHREHQQTLAEVQTQLERAGAQVLYIKRAHAAFDTSGAALVIAVGGDGTLLAASQNVGDVPILGVNSAPSHSVGFFCAAFRTNFGEYLQRALAGKLPAMRLTRMSVSVNGRLRSSRVLNEALYCHSSPAATSRYIVQFRNHSEEQTSSGFWIGPAAGSTAAQHSAGGKVLPFSSQRLQLVVREPYVPFGKKYKLLKVLIPPSEVLTIRSKMDDSSLFLDGPHRQIAVRLGDEVVFSASKEPLRVFGVLRARS